MKPISEKQLRKMAESGKSMRECADIIGINYKSFTIFARMMGVKFKTNGHDAATRKKGDEYRALMLRGMTASEIAREVGLHPSAIAKTMKRCGYEPTTIRAIRQYYGLPVTTRTRASKAVSE